MAAKKAKTLMTETRGTYTGIVRQGVRYNFQVTNERGEIMALDGLIASLDECFARMMDELQYCADNHESIEAERGR